MFSAILSLYFQTEPLPWEIQDRIPIFQKESTYKVWKTSFAKSFSPIIFFIDTEAGLEKLLGIFHLEIPR